MKSPARAFRWMMAVTAFASSGTVFAGVHAKTIDYKDGKDTFEGILVYPDHPAGKLPGILMIHNWMGVTEETKHQAERMAELGYVVFAADIYGKGQRPKTAQDAGTLATSFKADRALFRKRLQLGLATLRAQDSVKTNDVIAVGYCFGGTGVIELARSGADVKGVVGFHAGLDSPKPEDGKNIKGRVLVLQGGDDPFVKPEDLAAFENELRTNHVDWELVKYGGAVHSYTEKAAGNDNSKGAAYNASADARSFAEFKRFAKEVL